MDAVSVEQFNDDITLSSGRWWRRFTLFLTFSVLMPLATACNRFSSQTSSCVRCHKSIENVSKNHTDCISCHGGNPETTDKTASHLSMFGPRNPSDPRFWEKSCGRCHRYQLERVKSNLMYTNTGMIKNIQLTWEGDDKRLFATEGMKQFNAAGQQIQTFSVAELNNLSGELYRKFCSQCHVGIETGDVFGASHASGCAACHFPYNDVATYMGNDPTVRGKSPYSASHTLTGLPDNQVCSRCHNRSGRIALSYEGLYDGNNGLVPTRGGLPGPKMISGARNVVHIAPDVHAAAGMDCIDCHTSRDVMGDGFAYENMYRQTEISCADCHGDAGKPPQYVVISREHEEPLRESGQYKMRVRYGMRMILTAKGKPYSNVYTQNGKVVVLGKRSGKLFTSTVITGTPEHTISGHGRLECYSCHSRTVVQCYGCHTRYDKTEQGRDFVKKMDTPGRFSETEDYRTLYPFPLALNQRGKISPVTPGCQTFITVAEPDGSLSKDEYVARFKGKQQLRFAPFYSHNTGKHAVGCAECHANPTFLGFGQHIVEGRSIKGTLLCPLSDSKPLDGFLTMDKGKVRAYSAITRENSRPLNQQEVQRTLAVNLCLVCHASAKDPIYRKRINYRDLDDSLHHRLLAPR